MLRSHTCGELDESFLDKEVTLCGWCNARRDHGGVVFIDLRDRYGLTQIVFNPDIKDFDEAVKLRREDVIKVIGSVKKRPSGMENPNLSTGKIDVIVFRLEVLNKAETPPLEIDDRVVASDDLRLKFRYLDLRRPIMQKRLMIRHKAATAARDYLNSKNFVEIETPLLIRATPEGARDYVVPSRVNPGKFFSLPQSPQLYKQILMVSGMDRYYQLAKCLRDEDLRADRQPEFTQIDIEMSFVDVDDIIDNCEGLIKHIWKKAIDADVSIPFPRMKYYDAMNRFGSDKPDLRFGLEIVDVSDVVKKSDFQVFKSAECVKCLNPEKDLSRKELDELTVFVSELGAKGLAWCKYTDKGLEGSIIKFLNQSVQDELLKKVGAKKGSTFLFIADEKKKTNTILGQLRLELGKRLNIIPEGVFRFVWIVDFPLFEWDADNDRWAPMHHIFSMPQEDSFQYLESDPGKVLGKLYDLALNGIELGGGSIRIHKKEIQERVLKVIGMDYAVAEQRFGFLLRSFNFGAPPHGGLAFGLDRISALLCGFNDIREVIAFPKNKAAECPMDSCPSDIEDEQMKELHIKSTAVVKKKNQVLEDIRMMLDKEKVEFKIFEHDPVFTSEDAAKARGTKIEQSAKALVLKADDHFVMAVVAGDKELDLVKLKSIIKAEKLGMASSDEVKKVTACGIGSVPPFGNLFSLDTFVDESVLKNEFIAFNAGSHTTSLMITSKALVDLVRPKVGNFSKGK